MNWTPEQIEAGGKVIVIILGALFAGVGTLLNAFYTWKNGYHVDKLYSLTYRQNPDGTPGPMRRGNRLAARVFDRGSKDVGIKPETPAQSQALERNVEGPKI